ncbi:Beta-secretase [Galdieria sulphuraria]|uniref:Aspartyl protease n=1 Tax=Galdieria sulphuraria TaxID=130081 RepID=M2WSY0_GALSU|nr:aspartyl protease [Galdieria sulphuraria]EME26995.1 aspartyl protease [Galdieria sulphuraria]GJD10994.1 Beta-secretase [Galdieria sulphuraria]|eukprot:XP_005703515.1 aspartyl protease [Galdieria sulphuraria]
MKIKSLLCVLFYSLLIFSFFEPCFANFISSSEGLRRLEVKRVANSFETLVSKDRHRWSSRTKALSWKALQEYGKDLQAEKQELSPLANSRYKEMSLHGNVIPDGGYYVDLEIGGQKTAAQIDTGSSNLIIPIRGCKGCSSEGMIDISQSPSGFVIPCNSSSCNSKTCSSQLCITESCSKTNNACCYEALGVSGCFFLIVYGTGAAAGVYFNDTVQIAGFSTRATIGGILRNVSDYPVGKATGVIGMAFKGASCNPSCATPLFEDLVRTNNLSDIFSIRLGNEGGSLTLGGIDHSLYSGDIHYIPLRHGANSLLYDLSCKGIKIGNSSLISTSSGAVVDSGTTTLVFDSKYFEDVKKYFQSNLCDIPLVCSNSSVSETIFTGGGGVCGFFSSSDIEKFPTITIEITSNFHISLEPKDYMLQVPLSDIESNGNTTIPEKSRTSSSGDNAYCFTILEFPGLESSEGYSMILGDTVLKNYYVVFNRENYSVGFASLS